MVYAQSFPLPDPQSPAPNLSFGSDLAVRPFCPAHVFEDLGDWHFVCACGLVLGDQIVNGGNEWHVSLSFSKALSAMFLSLSACCFLSQSVVQTFAIGEYDGPSLDGAASNPLTEGMERLGTDISSQDNGTSGLRLAASLRKECRLRAPLSVFRDISHWCDQFLESDTVCDLAKQLYKRTYEAKLLRGKPLDAIIAACIFVACRQAHIPRTFREICDIMRVSKKLLGHCYKTLVRAFDLAPGLSTNPSGSSSTAPEALLARYCDQLDLSTRVHSVGTDIIVAARNHGIAVGRSPISIAAGAIYYTGHLLGEVKTVQDICAVSSVGESTVKLIFRLLHANKAKLVKQEWIDEGRTKLQRCL